MMEASLKLQAESESVPARVSSRWSLLVGSAAAVGIWAAPSRPVFLASWVALFTWACVRAATSGGQGRALRLPVLAPLAGLVTAGLAAWNGPTQPLAALGMAIAGGVLPFHLWLEELRRRLSHREYLLLLLCQPGVIWLHRFVQANPTALRGSLGTVLLLFFVASAILQSGLGLVRQDPARAISAITLSQSCLLLAGCFTGHIGWEAARALLIAMVAGTLVLLSVIGLLRDTYGVEKLAPDNGLADVAPDLHRLFIAMGWLFVGLPGGLAFFAEDLLFHALLEHSTVATAGFLLTTALNAIVFYRVYAGLFCGPSRRGQQAAPAASRSRRWYVAILTAVTVLVVIGGLAPALFL